MDLTTAHAAPNPQNLFSQNLLVKKL